MSKRYSRWEAQTLFEAYAEEALGSSAATLPVAVEQAQARLNRAAKRALGARGDGRYTRFASHLVPVRSRNAW